MLREYKLSLLKNLGWTKFSMVVKNNIAHIDGFYIPPYNTKVPLELYSKQLKINSQIHTLMNNKKLGNYTCAVYEVQAECEIVEENEIIQVYTVFANGTRANLACHDWYWIQTSIQRPFPNLEMMKYIGADDKDWFHFAGGSWAEKSLILWEQLTNKNRDSLGSILDFGCGVARVSKHYLDICNAQITGIDIDKNCIDWCRINLPQAQWYTVDANDNLPFENNSFELVIGHSVFTHFEEAIQLKKLKELSRVTKEGGYVMMTILGEYAHFLEPMSFTEEEFLCQNGTISPESMKKYSQKHPLIAADYPNYHKGVFNTHKFIHERWSKDLNVISIIEGFADHQALVILQKEKIVKDNK